MEETLEGGRGPPRAVAPLERERENIVTEGQVAHLETEILVARGVQLVSDSEYQPTTRLTHRTY
jgi:hypothetical protein